MTSKTRTLRTGARPPRARRRPGLARKIVERLLPAFDSGRLVIHLPNGEEIDIATGNPGPEASITLARWRALWRFKAGGDVGFARGYLDGDWHTPDLDGVLEFGVSNDAALSATARGSALAWAGNRIRHLARANTKRGSQRNIFAHYDLGNSFYSHWLDPDMNYSSGFYETGTETLEAAQTAKLDRIVAELDIRGGERVLDIGCGWGSLAERLAKREGCAVTGVTLSRAQLAHAKDRFRTRSGRGSADLRLQDYRDLEGRYDRIVSIEMIEAVGQRYWPVYLRKLHECLSETGTALLQAITIDEAHFPAYSRRTDFIQRYIFPGGMLPTVEIIRREAERAGLELISHQPFGQSYARTLSEWRRRFLHNWHDIEACGFDTRFRRMWEYYLAYCEIGFRFGRTDVGFFKLARR